MKTIYISWKDAGFDLAKIVGFFDKKGYGGIYSEMFKDWYSWNDI